MQREGRAGRVRDGHCFRLYTQYTFEVSSFISPLINRMNYPNSLFLKFNELI